MSTAAPDLKKLAFRFVLIIGIVNLFADMTYEGGRAIGGPFLGALGAGAAVVGLVAGLGELMGYGLRSVFGYLADKTHRYWTLIFIGYAINLLAVPALALAGNWPVAAALLIAERTGRAIRKPSAETMLSYAGKSLGQGWVFGLNEALDQAGAAIGPLIAALGLYFQHRYQFAFGLLLVPALLCLGALTAARIRYPRPHELEGRAPQPLRTKGFSTSYWIYLAAAALIAAGFADFSLIAFHFRQASTVPQDVIPVYYSVAMVTSALAALLIGRLLDSGGLRVLIAAFLAPVFSAPLVFFGGAAAALVGMVLWGVGIAAQDAGLKAVLAGFVPRERRGAAFGVFDTGFGIAWFLGSVAMGFLYEHSIFMVVVLSMVLQLASFPLLFLAKRPPSQQFGRKFVI
ncbi:MAG: MFS transporter [Acidobacteriaceae bacterium]|nr:MFS transporter [Acidobacteriaceae bacterium]